MRSADPPSSSGNSGCSPLECILRCFATGNRRHRRDGGGQCALSAGSHPVRPAAPGAQRAAQTRPRAADARAGSSRKRCCHCACWPAPRLRASQTARISSAISNGAAWPAECARASLPPRWPRAPHRARRASRPCWGCPGRSPSCSTRAWDARRQSRLAPEPLRARRSRAPGTLRITRQPYASKRPGVSSANQCFT